MRTIRSPAAAPISLRASTSASLPSLPVTWHDPRDAQPSHELLRDIFTHAVSVSTLVTMPFSVAIDLSGNFLGGYGIMTVANQAAPQTPTGFKAGRVFVESKLDFFAFAFVEWTFQRHDTA